MLINVFNASVSAVWLILAVALLRLLLKRAPKWITCLLWAMVGLRLVMPFSIESMFSLIPSANTLPQTIAYDPVPQINSGVPAVNNAINPVLSEHFAAVPENSANPMQILLELGELLWVAGMIAMVLYLVISFVVLRLKMRTATRMRDNIMQSERVASPFVMGIIRPVIYLPYNMDESAKEYVIAHEQAHIRRGDHIVKPIAFLVLTLHWFNPFVWLAYVLLCRDIELACDQRVVRDMPAADRKDYSRTLVNVNSSRRAASACPLAFSEVGVKERVKSVLSYKKPALWIIVAAVVVCAVTALCFMTDPMKKHDPFGKSYRVKEVIYLTSLSYNEDYQPEGDFGEWVLTEDHRLTDAEIFFTQGRFEEINLTKENFDDLCVEVDVPNGRWPKGMNPARLRGENQSAWKLQDVNSPGRFGLLLQQKNGEVYLAEGGKIENYEGPYSTFIRSVVLIEEVTAFSVTDLDLALNKAALEENKGGYLSGQFRCAAHTILATESEIVDENTTRLTAYAIMLYQEYSLNNGIPEDVSGSSCPVAVTFDITAAGEYTLVEYWEPMDGSMYPESLREKFPDGVSWNTQLGHKERNESCYRQACEHFGVPLYTTGGAEDPALDAAINKAAMEEYSADFLSGEFRCMAYTLLYKENERPDTNIQRLTAYIIITYRGYDLVNGVPETTCGINCPAAITFNVSSAGEYLLEEFWMPEDGEGYYSSLEAKFPPHISWDTDIGYAERENSCKRQACQYFAVDNIVDGSWNANVPTTTTAVYIDQTTQSAALEREYELISDEFGVVVLRTDGRFKMVLGTENTTELTGNYSESQGTLILSADDQPREAVFAVSKGALTFDAQASTWLSVTDVLTDSSVFAQKVGYMCALDHSIFGQSALTLRADGQATLYFGYLSSYIACGQYDFDGKTLTLRTDDGMQRVYVFEKSGENFVFRAEDSSPIPMFKPAADAEPEAVFGDGAVFERF